MQILFSTTVGPYAYIPTPLSQPTIGRIVFYGDNRDNCGPKSNGAYYDWSFKEFSKRLLMGRWEAMELLFCDLSRVSRFSPVLIPLFKSRRAFLTLGSLEKALKRAHQIAGERTPHLPLVNRKVGYGWIISDFVSMAIENEALEPGRRPSRNNDPLIGRDVSDIVRKISDYDNKREGPKRCSALLKSDFVRHYSNTRNRLEGLCRSYDDKERSRGYGELGNRIPVSFDRESRLKREQFLVNISDRISQIKGPFPKFPQDQWAFFAKTDSSSDI